MNAMRDLKSYVNYIKTQMDNCLRAVGPVPPVSWSQLVELYERIKLADAAIKAAGEYGMEDDPRIQAYLDHVRENTYDDSEEESKDSA